MKNPIIILLHILFTFHYTNLQAQQKNQINMYLGLWNSGFLPTDFYTETNYWSVSYFRTINKKYQIWFQYHNKILNEKSDFYFHQNLPIKDNGYEYNWGAPLWRNKIYGFDIGGGYSVLDKNRHHIIAMFGLSYIQANTSYVKEGSSLEFPNDNIVIKYYYKNKNYIGPNIGIKYDYYLLHNRVNVGAHVQWKFYFGDMPNLSNIGVHVGFNF